MSMTILARRLENTVKARFKDAKQHSTQLVWIKDAKINKRGSSANMNHAKPNASQFRWTISSGKKLPQLIDLLPLLIVHLNCGSTVLFYCFASLNHESWFDRIVPCCLGCAHLPLLKLFL